MVNVTKGILVECDPAMKQVLLSIYRDFHPIGYISVSSASWWEVHSWLKIYHPGDKFYFLSIVKKHLFSGSWRDPLVHLSRRAGATKSSDRWLDGQDIGAHCWGRWEEVKFGMMSNNEQWRFWPLEAFRRIEVLNKNVKTWYSFWPS